MTNPTADNVLIGHPLVTGGVLVGDAQPAPADATTALAVGYAALGYVGENGLELDPKRESKPIKAWGGDEVADPQNGYSETWTFTLIEPEREAVLGVVYGDDNVTPTAADGTHGNRLAGVSTGEQLPVRQWVFELLDGERKVRYYLPKARVTETGKVVFKDDTEVGFEVTLKAYRDSSGYFHYRWSDDGNPTTAVPSEPLRLAGAEEAAGIVVLDWDAPAEGGVITGYKVYQSSTQGGSFVEVTTNITKVGTTARLTSVASGTKWFKVAATNSVGTGDQTAAISVTVTT